MKTKIYYDGVNIQDFIEEVDGGTTNTSYIADAGINDYNKFIDETLQIVGDKPVSFQVTARTLEEIEAQAAFLTSKAKNIFVKIPILLPDKISTAPLIKKLCGEGVKVNVTCIHTFDQIKEAVDAIDKNIA